MPKKRMLKVVADPQPRPDVAYMVQVTASEPHDDILRVTVRHVSHAMDGFTRVFDLRLPLTPNSLAAALFRSAGVATEIDAEIDPKAVVGKLVSAYFACLPGCLQPQPVAFEPVKKEDAHV
jgi:hypothetical protein